MKKLDYDKKKGIDMKKEMKEIERDIYESSSSSSGSDRDASMQDLHEGMEETNRKMRKKMGLKG